MPASNEARESYREQLNDARWQRKKAAIMERDDYKCQATGCSSDSNVQLQVHHRYYLLGRAPWEYEDRVLVTMCKACHQKNHANNSANVQRLLAALYGAGFYASDLGAIGEALAVYWQALERAGHSTDMFPEILRQVAAGINDVVTSGRSEPVNLTVPDLTCRHCGGSGYTVGTATQPAHAPDCDGTCVNCPVPESVPVQVLCEACAGSGRKIE